MPAMPIELILMRQWSLHLATPVLIVDTQDHLVFLNDAAQALIGVGAVGLLGRPLSELAVAWGVHDHATDLPLDDAQLAVSTLASNRGPKHIRLRFQQADGGQRIVDMTALPLEGQGERDVHADTSPRGAILGAALLFWEVEES